MKASSRFPVLASTSDTRTPIAASALMTDAARSPVPVTVTYLCLPLDVVHTGYRSQGLLVNRLRWDEADPAPSRLRRDRFRRVERHDGPMVDEREAITQSLCLVHEVSHQDHRHATVSHAFDEAPGFTPCLRIKPRGQLVEDGELRVAHQSQGDRQPLFLAARKVLNEELAICSMPSDSSSCPDPAGSSRTRRRASPPPPP